MHTRNLDYLLESAVAKALGVNMPVHRRRPHRAKKSAATTQPVRRAA